jgi:hypothetical protein
LLDNIVTNSCTTEVHDETERQEIKILDTTMDLRSHLKHRIGVIRTLKYSAVASIALYHVIIGGKAHSILSYKRRILCRIPFTVLPNTYDVV